MSKVFKYVIAYGMWFVDLGLATWLFYISRTALLAFLALSYDQADYQYPMRADVADKIFTLLLGIGWLAFMVITEEYFRAGAHKESLMKRFARVTGSILLTIFFLDLTLFWLQGIEGGDWLRWLILSAELVIGLVLVLYGKKSRKTKLPKKG